MTSPRFFDVPPEQADYATAEVVILPVPYERTTSYGRGTRKGPAAILAASAQVELYEEMTGTEPFRRGIATIPPCDPQSKDPGAALETIRLVSAEHLAASKFLVSLGGEHSLTIGPVRAVKDRFGEVGVVQFDAHADLRPSYEGSPHSHACVMRRVLEEELPTLAVGVRAVERKEAELVHDLNLPVIWAWELHEAQPRFEAALEQLPDTVYLTFDVDYLDPSIMPATGTPVPGGGLWFPTLELLRTLFARKRVVAMDIVELAPVPRLHSCNFLVAQLLYKCLAFR